MFQKPPALQTAKELISIVRTYGLILFQKELIKARGAENPENLSRRSLSTPILSAGRSLTGLSDFGHTSPYPVLMWLIASAAGQSARHSGNSFLARHFAV